MTDYQLFIHIAEKIARVRKEQGLSQMDLALKAGISRSFLGRIERMESIPSLHTLRKIEMALSLPDMALTGTPRGKPHASPDAIEHTVQALSELLYSHNLSADELRMVEKAIRTITNFIIE